MSPSSSNAMRQGVARGRPLAVPDLASGTLQEVSEADAAPDARTDERLTALYVRRGYEAIRNAVKEWGGDGALAALWNTSTTNVSQRLNRREVNGALNYAFADWIFIACTKPQAAEQFLFDLCDLFGFDHPKRKRTKTIDEKYGALVANLRRLGPLGEKAIEVAARDLGVDPAEFDR